MDTSNSKGEFARLKVEMEANKRGLYTSRPNAEHLSYDLIIDDDGKISRAQVKYCDRLTSYNKNDLELTLYGKRSKRKYYHKKYVDILLVYLPKHDIILKYGSEFFHKKKTIGINLTNKNSKNWYGNYIW